MRVLVVAPQFPSLNQPWIDTYLAGLARHGFAYTIATTIASPAVGPGVVNVSETSAGLAKRLGGRTLRNPLHALRDTARVLAVVQHEAARVAPSARTVAWVMYLLARREEFGDFDVLHAHAEIEGFQLLWLALAIGRPFVLTFHGLPPTGVGQLATPKRRLLYHHAAAVFVNTLFAQRQVLALGCPPEKVIVLPQGLPLERFPFAPAKYPGPRSIRLLTVGRFHPDKGHRYALLACARLVGEGIELRYDIIGVGTRADRERIEGLVARLGLGGRVTIHEGASPAVVGQAYHDANIFILPSVRSRDGSHEETQGVVLQEAQASGCIPVTTRVGGIPECVNDRSDALVVGDRSSRAIAGAIRHLIDHPELWESFQRAGRANVETRFSAEVIARAMAGHLTRASALSR